jgi:hypothetical protein
MAAPTQDDFNNLLKSIKDLTKSLGTSNDTDKKANKATLDLTVQLASIYKSQEAFTKASELQTKLIKYNADASKVLSTTLTKAPGFTNLETGMTLLEAGLESNSKGLGEFFARASLLGQNIEQMAFGLRNLTGTLGLNNTQTVLLAESIEDSAKTYGTSSERLVDSLNKSGGTLALLYRTNTGTNDALEALTAATDRAAPGGLAAVLGPLIGGGVESLGRLGVLGIGEEISALMRGEGGISSGMGIFEKIINLRDQIVGTGEQAIIGAQIFEQMTGLTLAQANLAEKLANTLKEQQGKPELEAQLSDAFGTLTAIMEEIRTPLAELTVIFLTGLNGVQDILKHDIAKYLIKVAGATAILFTISASLRLISLLTKKSNLFWFGIYTAVAALYAPLESIVKGLGGIAEDTKTTADIAKNQQENRTLSLLEEYNKRHAATLNTLIREDNKMNLEPLLTEKEALTQSVKQTQLFEIMVKMIGDQNDMLGKKTSAFTPNPAGIK